MKRLQIYRSGPYRLSGGCKKFEIDSLKWHSMDPEAGMKHVEQFCRYKPALNHQFNKRKSSGRKPSCRKWTRKPDLESAFDRLDKKESKSRKPFKILAPQKRDRRSYFSVHWYRTWLINFRKTVRISNFQRTNKIVLS